MTISVTPTEQDLQTMLDIVNADAVDPPPEGLPLPVLDALCRLHPGRSAVLLRPGQQRQD